MHRVRFSIVAGAAIVLLAGCSLMPSFVDRESVDPTATAAAELPSGTVQGWPAEMVPAFYLVSSIVAEACPEAPIHMGPAFLERVPAESFPDVTGVACAFGPPPSGRSDSVVEVAYRVDSGLAALLEAYAQSGSAGTTQDLSCFEASHAPFVIVDLGGEFTIASPGPEWCYETHPEWKAIVDALELTVMVADEATFAESQD